MKTIKPKTKNTVKPNKRTTVKPNLGTKKKLTSETNDDKKKYSLTLKGLLSSALIECDIDTSHCDKILNTIELYLRRFYSKHGCPAIILDDNKFIFASVGKKK